MLDAFRGSDNPPAVAIRTWYVPAAARFDGLSLHGYKVGASRHCLSLSLRSPLLDVSVSLFSWETGSRLTGALQPGSYPETNGNRALHFIHRHPVA